MLNRNDFLNDLFDEYLDALLGSQQEVELLEEIGLLMQWTDEKFDTVVTETLEGISDAIALRYDRQNR